MPLLKAMALPDLLSTKVAREGKVTFDGLEFPIACTPAQRPTENLLIKFHGAVNRKARTLPVFSQPNRALEPDWHQISIGDPLLYLYDNLWISWYCGDPDRDVQNSIIGLISEIKDHLRCSIRVYLGSSGGGFAALWSSAHDPESIALALNPQTVLQNYNPEAVQKYVTQCWPEASSIRDIGEHRVIDVTDAYKKPPGNTVIYLQNAADAHHLHKHFSPFLNTVAARTDKNDPIDFIADVALMGGIGHKPVPAEVYLNWLKIIANAEDTSGDALLRERAHQIANSTPVPPSAPTKVMTGSFAEEDIAMANAIVDWNMK